MFRAAPHSGGASFPAPIPGNPTGSGRAIRPPVQREPINVQRWLTRAGIVATLLGAAYVLAELAGGAGGQPCSGGR
ncbi:hypothetical protein [Deinococcus sp.]|uniref:hypothetical protein n=1 Tax=Deinococcus sp. TaxID=47478 RepID=UPI003C7C199D